MRFSALRETGLNRTLAEVEAEYIGNVLASVDGNKTQAAKILGIDRKTLREKLKLQGLE
jgi:DNA-binding protein Fis